MTQDQERAGFAVVKEARAWLAEQTLERAREDTRTPSQASAQSYQQDFERLKAKGDVWQAASGTTKKSSFFKYRAAILHHCREEIQELLQSQDKLQRNNALADPETKDLWLIKISRLKSALEMALKAPPKPQLKKVVRRQTKRKNLWRLPEDWREQLVERMPRYRSQAAITALCGCRPAELVYGVRVDITSDLLTVLIKGAKVGVKSGQEWRKMSWRLPSSNPLAMLVFRIFLEGQEEPEDGSMLISTPDARLFSNAMKSAGQRAFPQFPHNITPYSMRHQFASDLKTVELPGDQISQALGHAVSDTKGSYGAFGYGRAGMEPDAVQAARQVRNTQAQAQTEGPLDAQMSEDAGDEPSPAPGM